MGTVTRWARPNNVNQLHSFLSFNNYFYRFIQGYSTLVARLIHLTRKNVKYIINVKYIWTDQCQESFEGVKYALNHMPILNLPIFGKRFEVICDVSLLGIGTIFLQEGRLHYVMFWAQHKLWLQLFILKQMGGQRELIGL